MTRPYFPFSDAGGTVRLLLVEDHAGLAEAMQEFLQSEGFEVRLAASGREALAATAFQPDVVLCDLNLPDMGGLEVLSALRKNPGMGHVLMVIYSAAWVPPGHRLQAPEADLFLSKPIDIEKLAILRAELQRLREEMHGQ
jgi:CheY-like chemotaxis protein